MFIIFPIILIPALIFKMSIKVSKYMGVLNIKINQQSFIELINFYITVYKPTVYMALLGYFPSLLLPWVPHSVSYFVS